jgi:hypothetical protein
MSVECMNDDEYPVTISAYNNGIGAQIGLAYLCFHELKYMITSRHLQSETHSYKWE